MLTFEEKLAIIESFPELERKDVSLKRVNFHFEESATDKKNVVYHLHPNGNGFVYAGNLKGYETDDKGLVNIRDFSTEELRTLLEKTIRTLAWVDQSAEVAVEEPSSMEQSEGETWKNYEKHTLILMNEMDTWNVYSGLNLDATFDTYEEAKEYLLEEGFRKKNATK
jgi:hypothetical protein